MANNPNKHNFEMVGDVVSIFQRGRRWFANFQLDGKQHRPALQTTSKKEARRRAILLEGELLEGRYRLRIKAPSVETGIDKYLSHQQTEGRAKKTIQKIDLTCRRVKDLATQHKARSLLNIDLAFVDEYRRQRVEQGAKPKTVHNETVIIKQLINFARRRKMITSDPLEELKITKPKPTRQPCWTRAEADRILAAAQAPHRTPLTLLGETGMRVGELKYLTWDDIDFPRSRIVIQPKDEWRPKTGDQRWIPMSPVARTVLQALPRSSRWVVTSAASRHYPAGDHQISERRLLQYLKRVLKRLGLRGHLHTFRHSFISHALTQGIPEAVVREWVGHVDRDVIKQYTHIADEASQAAMQRLAQAPSQTLQPGGLTDGQKTSEAESAQSQHNERSHENAPDAN